MRLWHYKLIEVLPNQMLVSQWRECIAIKRQWEKGTLTHRLANYVLKYDKIYFLEYVREICSEMKERNINYNDKYYLEIVKFADLDRFNNNDIYPILHYPEHNEIYLKQCYYNLQEKFHRRYNITRRI